MPVTEVRATATASPPTALKLDGVGMMFKHRRGWVRALMDVSFEVADGEFVAVLGASGCGKSTLLRLIAGLLTPTSGSVSHAEEIARQGGMGMVFQEPVLLPWRNVRGNILAPAEILSLDRTASETRSTELIKQVRLDGFEDALPHQLSGGMQQRVALCRALLSEPPLLLMDEPFGALDAITREQMNLDLQEIWSLGGRTIILVTHSIEEALFLADRVVIMTPRPGRIAEIVDTGLPRPRNAETLASPEFASLADHVRRMVMRIDPQRR
jgi:NitT/TauT family transport system ATP-binding protein